MSQRVLIVAVVATLVAAATFYVTRPERGLPDDAPSLDAMADAIGAPVMQNIFNGHVPGRSPEVMLVPRPHRFIITGDWPLVTLDDPTPNTTTSHPNPWAYLARVPIVLYGPGYVPSGREVTDEVDISGLAPTYAELLGMDGFESDGTPLPGALSGGAGRLPKVIFTVVIDGGGWNALQEHPDSWPEIAELRRGGTTYVNATIGSAPSITGALHATFGSGFYPLHHGLPGNQMRNEDGENVDTWLREADPRYLEVPTVSELWDEQNGNRPVVATVSYEGWHLGMIGHGSQRAGGDRDIAALWEAAESEWWINEDYYELPPYLQTTDLARLERYEAALDPRDGIADGAWYGVTPDEIVASADSVKRFRPATPAFATFTGDAVMDVLRNEGIGADGLTDLMWVEIKAPDFSGHVFNVTDPTQADVIRETDRQIGRFKDYLDETVGRGNYVFAVSADHGQQPFPELHGGWRINGLELERDIERRFGDVVEKISPVDIYIDMERLDDEGVELEEIARYVGTYTLGENIPEGQPGADLVPEGRMEEKLFAGAFPTGYLASLTSEKIESFGDSDYPEGDFVVGPGDTSG